MDFYNQEPSQLTVTLARTEFAILASFVALLVPLLAVDEAVAQAQACVGLPNGSFVRNPRSCAHFFSCLNGIATEGQCTGGLYFDPRLEMCRHPQYVECETVVGVDCPLTPAFSIQAFPSTCEQFVTCANGFPTLFTCPLGLHFNAALGICDVPANAGCLVGWCDTLAAN